MLLNLQMNMTGEGALDLRVRRSALSLYLHKRTLFLCLFGRSLYESCRSELTFQADWLLCIPHASSLADSESRFLWLTQETAVN